MTTKFQRYTPEILLFIYVILFLLVKNPADRHDRVLISDGKGYYAYLTAIFIYHDLDFQFIEDYEAKYYGHDTIKDFRLDCDGKIVNMYFPGLALLMLPFFLIAHLLSLILGFPADGYSIIYQYAIGLGALFYLWAGLKFLQKLLRTFSFSIRHVSIILIIIALGTNINYYTLKEGAMSHVYSFAVIATFLYTIHLAVRNPVRKWLILSAFLFGLIVFIRPTNGLVILLVPFMAGTSSALVRLIRSIFSKPAVFFPVILAAAAFPFMMMLLWYLQTGHWFVYSYGGFGFDFTDPHFLQILFSFDKGWFIYTPVALISLAGLAVIFKENRFRFWWGIAFLVIFIYVQSSWFCWNFTSNFGNRAFIDIYPLIAVFLAYAIVLFRKRHVARIIFSGIIILLVILNNVQFYQHYKYIFPPGTITFQKYRDAFKRLIPTARFEVEDSLIISKEVFTNDFEEDYGWLNYASVTDTMAYRGQFSSRAGLANDYSIGLLVDALPLFKSDSVVAKVSGWYYSNLEYSGGQLIIQMENNGKGYFYRPFYLNEYNLKDQWVYMEFGCTLPYPSNVDDQFRVFMFNTKPDELLMVDDLKVEIFSLKK